MPSSKPRVAVFFGGDDPHHDSSYATGLWLCQHMPRDQYEVVPVYIQRDGRMRLPLGTLPKQGPVQPMIDKLLTSLRPLSPRDGWQRLLQHPIKTLWSVVRGRGGDDGGTAAQGLALRIPVVGSSQAACNIAHDKQLLSGAVEDMIALPYTLTLHTPEVDLDLVRENLLAPLFLKPARAEGSFGVELVQSSDELAAAGSRVAKHGQALAQEQLKGTEINVTIVQDATGRQYALPPTAISPRRSPYYDFDAKKHPGNVDLTTVAEASDEKLAEAVSLAHAVFDRLNFEGFGSFDFVLTEDDIYLLEANTIPSISAATPLRGQLLAAKLHPGRFIDQQLRLTLE